MNQEVRDLPLLRVKNFKGKKIKKNPNCLFQGMKTNKLSKQYFKWYWNWLLEEVTETKSLWESKQYRKRNDRYKTYFFGFSKRKACSVDYVLSRKTQWKKWKKLSSTITSIINVWLNKYELFYLIIKKVVAIKLQS